MARPDTTSLQTPVRLLAPQLFLFAIILLSVLKLPFPYAGSVRPALLLMIVYYWSIYRPTLLPPALCFCAGLAVDILSGAPLGLNALVLVAVQWLIASQRRFLMGQNYLMLWAVFALVGGLAALTQWALYGLINLHWTSLTLPAASVGLSLLCFPLMTIVLIGLHKLLPVPSRP